MPAHLKLESLEARENPAADVYFDGPMLVINTDDESDTAFLTESAGLVFLNVNGVEFEPLPREAHQDQAGEANEQQREVAKP